MAEALQALPDLPVRPGALVLPELQAPLDQPDQLVLPARLELLDLQDLPDLLEQTARKETPFPVIRISNI